MRRLAFFNETIDHNKIFPADVKRRDVCWIKDNLSNEKVAKEQKRTLAPLTDDLLLLALARAKNNLLTVEPRQPLGLIEHPIDGVCSTGPWPVSATCFIASKRSRRAFATGVMREASSHPRL